MKSKYRVLSAVFPAAIIILLFVWSCAGRPGAGMKSVQDDRSMPEEARAFTRIRLLTDEFKAMLNEGDEKHPVAVLHRGIEEYLLSDQVKMVLYSQEENPEAASVLFQYTRKNGDAAARLALAFSSEKLLDYRQYKSCLLSEYVYSLKQINDFVYKGGEYISAMKSDLGRYLYEMDALYYQAMFLRDYSAKHKLALNEYEQLLVRSLAEDNLARMSLYFKRVDMDLLYSMHGLQLKYANNEISLDDYLSLLLHLGQKIKNQAKFGSEWETVISVIKMYTYDYYLPYIINDFWADADETDDSVFSEYSDRLNKLKAGMKELTDQYNSEIVNFYAKIMEKYSKIH